MIKRIIICIMCLCLMFSVCVSAETVSDENTEAAAEEMPSESGEMTEKVPRGGMRGMPGDMQQPPQMPEGDMPVSDGSTSAENFEENIPASRGGGDFQMQQNGGGFRGGMQENSVQSTEPETRTDGSECTNIFKEYFTPAVSLIMLAFAFVFVIFYKRKRY